MSVSVPQGFRVAGVHCGIKRNPQKEDLTLVVCDSGATAAGVYTKNLVHAAPVVIDRARTPSTDIRVVVTNSGCANACTGDRGMADAMQMAAAAAHAIGAHEDQALVMSTGPIGMHLPMDKIRAGIAAAKDRLGTDEDSLAAAARGILTTDTVKKIAGRQIAIAGQTIQITGICKGSGMIGPNMATMLCMVMTDAKLSPRDAQLLLSRATDVTFNCTSVEGHMSTNDTVLLLASGAACSETLSGRDLDPLQGALTEVCEELAKAIAGDGEGASHLVTINVEGCKTRDDARLIAKTIANSALVKTAIAGADPNWGRIVSAAGYSGVDFNPHLVGLYLNGFEVYRHGAPLPFDAAQVSAAMRSNRDTILRLTLEEGQASCRFWTCDFTHEYIKINADYHT